MCGRNVPTNDRMRAKVLLAAYRRLERCQRATRHTIRVDHARNGENPPGHVLDIEGLRRDGTRVMLDVALIAILDEAGGLVGIIAIMREADHNIVA